MTSYKVKNFKKIIKNLDSGEKAFILSGFVLGLGFSVLLTAINRFPVSRLDFILGMALFILLCYFAFDIISKLEEVSQDGPQ